MNDADSSFDPDLEDVLCRLRNARPAAMPATLHQRIQSSHTQSAQPPGQAGKWVLVISGLLALSVMAKITDRADLPIERSSIVSVPATDEVSPPPSDSFLIQHHHQLLNAENAGIASSGNDTYQIVKLRVLHQAWSASRSGDPCILAETMSEEFVALPLEVF